jgi:6-phosphogluconolactonase/glucosamine-6-phosphate isomerase/deaminase
VMFMVAGADKADALRIARNPGPRDPPPCRRIQPVDGELLWLVDKAAAAGLLPG